MRSKLIAILAGTAMVFLLATNPVIANAARQITGHQIKNNTVTTKDIKNHTLKTTDMHKGVIAKVQRIQTDFEGTLPASSEFTFVGAIPLKVKAHQVVHVTGTVELNATTLGNDVDVAACYQGQSSSSAPKPLGGANSYSYDVDLNQNDNSLPVNGTAILSAGSYYVGMCVLPAVDMYLEVANGTVETSPAVAPLLRPAISHARTHHDG